MAKKTRQPALYEMMRMRHRGELPQVPVNVLPRADVDEVEEIEEYEVARDAATPSPVLEKLGSLLSPGRTLQIPVGYVLAAIAVLVLLLTVAYAVGSGRGRATARQEFEEKFGTAAPVSGVNDPLTLEPRNGSNSASGGGANANQRESSTPGGESKRTQADWGPVVPSIEPRQKGWNYFILAEDSLAGAQKLAEFCRANGLETYVIPGKNDRRRVIAFPGYQGSRLAAEVQALENRIHAVGDKYKSQNKSQTNMRDAYPALYNG